MHYYDKPHKEYELPESAGLLLDEWLTIYQRALPESLRQFDLTDIRKITYLAEGLDTKTIETHYKEGGVASCKKTVDWLSKKCKTFLERGPNNLIVFDNGVSKRTDPWINDEKEMKLHYLGEELYTSLSSTDITNVNVIERTIKKSCVCNYSIGIMTSLPDNLLPLCQELDDDIFRSLIENTEHITSMAFDGESYIIYSVLFKNSPTAL